MPWRETCVVDERVRFIAALREAEGPFRSHLQALRDQPQDGLQVAGALRGRRTCCARRRRVGAATMPARNAERGSRRGDRSTQITPVLGPKEAALLALRARADACVTGSEHDRHPALAPWLDKAAP